MAQANTKSECLLAFGGGVPKALQMMDFVQGYVNRHARQWSGHSTGEDKSRKHTGQCRTHDAMSTASTAVRGMPKAGGCGRDASGASG